jgi:glycosyltransferase involved in cell wall biosynthesis
MNIVIYSNRFWPAIGGVESGSRILARYLAATGHNVTVFTLTRFYGTELNEGYRVRRSDNLLSFAQTAFSSDLIVIKGGVSAFAGLGAALAHYPRVAIWHEMAGPYKHQGDSWTLRVSNFVRKQIALRASAHIGLTQACLESKDLADGIARYVIPTPVGDELVAYADGLKWNNREIDVLFVGRLVESKGILVLAEAIRSLLADGFPLRVRIVGDGDDRARMEAMLQNSPLLSVTFTGDQTGSALALSYASSKVLVVPSTTHPEGQAIVVAEGMAFGLPVIVSDQAVLREVLGDAGVITRMGDAQAIALALRKLLQDQSHWENLSKRARKQSELFSMKIFERSIDDLIEEIVGKGKTRIPGAKYA